MNTTDFFTLAKQWQHYFATGQQTPITKLEYEAVDALLKSKAGYGLDYTLTTLPKNIGEDQAVLAKLSGQLSRGIFFALVRRQWQTKIIDQRIDLAMYPWFAFAFTEIAMWSGTTRFEQVDFSGTVTKIALTVAMPFSYRTVPGDEVAQELVIYPDGQCFFETWVQGETEKIFLAGRKIAKKLPQTLAEQLYHDFFTHFSGQLSDEEAQGSGRWYVTFINEANQRVQFEGNVPFKEQTVPAFEQQMSTWLREHLQVEDFIGFDNRFERPKLLGFTFCYESETIQEKISLDYLKQQLCYEHTSRDYDVKQTYRGEEISEFMAALDDRHFQPRSVQQAELVVSPSTTQHFRCELTFAESIRAFSGNFDAEELPRGYKLFVNGIDSLLQIKKTGTLFDSALYEQSKLRTGQQIFLKVEFEDWGKGYHYLTDDHTIQIGDEVIVPVGPKNVERIATVVKKDYCLAEKAPFPIKKTKAIIRKATESDWDEFDE